MWSVLVVLHSVWVGTALLLAPPAETWRTQPGPRRRATAVNPPGRCPSVWRATDGSSSEETTTGNDETRVIMKFGGSSLASADRVREIASLVASFVEERAYRPVVVVSAMGKTTNAIMRAGELAEKEGRVHVEEIRALHLDTLEALDLPSHTALEVRGLLRDLESLLDGVSMVRELTPRTRDLLASFGERLSCRVVAAHLEKAHGVPAVPRDAWTLGVTTVGRFGDSTVNEACYGTVGASLEPLVSKGVVPVVTGFIGHDDDGRVVTLGRGGSDLTATALGAALKDCHEVQVWKDVDGMMSADPRVVRNAVPVPFATYDEAAELAYFGAQLLHPVSMQPALRAGLPVRIKNSYNPDHPGTLISSKEDSCLSKQCLVTAITSKRDITLVDVVSLRSVGQSGFLAAVFNTLERHGVSVDVVATSEVSVSLTLDKKTTVPPAAVRDLESFAQVQVRRNRAIVSLVGNNIKRESTHLVALAFAALDKRDKHVEMISQGASKVAVALVIEDDCADEVVTLLHDAFFDDVGTDTSSWSGPDVAERDAADAPRQKTAAIAAAERMAAR
mmetsp:Transcript_3694/g.14464  ORF Transcript_3694/g.14464 Transcript_3694/m.14464 type:complete len:561 (+) Transcript_3694:46-1728(+)